ncbi:hypothetical protein [Labrys neptuniae]
MIEITDLDRQRFEDKFIPEPMSGCWLWIGSIGSAGYGTFYLDCRILRANRASWLIYKGPLASRAQFVCHRCDNPACVNPDHLFLGDAASNVADMRKKGRNRFPDSERRTNARLCAADVLKIMADDRPQKLIAADYGVSQSIIFGVKAGRRWRHVTNGRVTSKGMPKGAQNIRAKLTTDQIREIRSDPRPSSQLAGIHCVSRQTIYRIRKGKGWAHVH